MTATQTEFTPAIPTISFTTGTAYDVLPDDGQPLRYFRTAYSRLEQHSNYTGDYRPNYVVVSRVERNGVATCNVNVTFRDPRGVVVDTWVHHSFLVPVGAAVGEVTIEQKVAALSEHMHQSIGTEDWPDAGDPGDWGDEDRAIWYEVGNRAVLERRTDIENGSVTAGHVWCEAAGRRDFSYDHTTEEFLHNWFRDERVRIDGILAALVPVAGQNLATPPVDPNLTRSLIEGDMVAYEGLLYRVYRTQREGDDIVTIWRDENGRAQRNRDVPRADVYWMEPGVAHVRRADSNDNIYPEVCVRGNEYLFSRVYSPQDRAIYVHAVGSTRALGYMTQSSFVPVLPASPRAWDQGRRLRTKQTVFTPNGEVGLVLAEDNVVHTDHRAGTIKVYKRTGSRWTDSLVPQTEVNFAMVGDPIVNDGVTGLFVRNDSDEMFDVTVEGVTANWRRQDCTYTGQPGAPKPTIENLVVVVDGVEYVRKDVIDKDIATQTAVLHKGSVEHSLCGVYDRVTAESDRRTEYIKMGPRYRDYDVQVEQTVVIRRTIRVTQAVDEATARTNARTLASDYTPRNIPGRRTGEPEMQIRSAVNTEWVGSATVVATP